MQPTSIALLHAIANIRIVVRVGTQRVFTWSKSSMRKDQASFLIFETVHKDVELCYRS